MCCDPPVPRACWARPARCSAPESRPTAPRTLGGSIGPHVHTPSASPKRTPTDRNARPGRAHCKLARPRRSCPRRPPRGRSAARRPRTTTRVHTAAAPTASLHREMIAPVPRWRRRRGYSAPGTQGWVGQRLRGRRRGHRRRGTGRRSQGGSSGPRDTRGRGADPEEARRCPVHGGRGGGS